MLRKLGADARKTSAAPAQPAGLAPRPARSMRPGWLSRPAPAPTRADTDEIPVGIAEFGAILRRRWMTIAASTALMTGLGLAYLMVAKPQFTASTMIFVDPRNRASFQIEGTGVGGSFDPNLVDSQIVLIESDTVLQRVISAEKLAEDPDFSRGPGDVQFNTLRNLKEAVKVKRPDRTYVVEVQVRARSGEKAARIANAIARAYVNDGRDSKNETAQREENWLDTHLLELQGRLKEAEARVEAYKVENRILGVEGRLVGEQQLSELNRGIVDAQRKAAEAKAGLDQVEAIRRSGRLPDTTNDALRSGVIERLRGQLSEILRLEANARSTLGPRHPAFAEIREQVVETRRQINEELGRIADGARSAYTVAQSNVTALERQLDALKRDATNTNKTLLRLRELERAVEAQKAVYEKFLRDKEQIARLSVDTPAGRIIAPALAPQRPSSPNKALILALAMVAGLFTGIGLALVLETLSQGGQKRRSPPVAPGSRAPTANPMPDDPDAPLMAMLPQREPAGQSGRSLRHPGRGRGQSPIAAPGSAYAEEMGLLAEDILARLDRQPVTTLMVSGIGRGNASPVLAVNLAVALAERGETVLLVDGRGSADGLVARLTLARRGVPAHLHGQTRTAFPIAGLEHLPVHVLPFGDSGAAQPPRNAVDAHGIVIIDGPPAGSRALSRIDLARHVDGVIAVLPAGQQPDAGTAATCDRAFGPSLIGVVGQAA
ncbi:MAG: exopolysaccharide transport family protein [Beijerinckiaceae bacterium]|nr:exopolysaccharide transport family protein [Beijerinckiaceae bacterium]